MPLAPGDRFGRYELTQLLGKGGMGEVFRARDTVLHREVALKVLQASSGGTADSKNPTDGGARILREARAAAGIRHPNAISIYDVGEIDGVAFLAMELVPGKTLRAFIRDPSIPLPRRLRWLSDIARALGAAHRLGLVHRDIKPENVMVGEDGIVKVLDFGIARRTGKIDASAPTQAGGSGPDPTGTLTGQGLVVGTPFYMAPEQMRGDSVDGRADQFAWGVVAYELLTGELPWDRDADPLKLVAQILSHDVPPPRTKNPDIPAPVDAVVRMALSKTATSRFATMEEIADELDAHASPTGVTTGRSSARRSVPSLDDVGLAPTQSFSSPDLKNAISTRTQLASPSVPAAVPPPKARSRALLVGAVAAMLVVGGAAWFATARAPAKTAAVADAAPLAEPSSQMSSNADATAAYKAGVQALRDGSEQTASEQLGRAIELDPLFAAAHLRRALLAYDEVTPEMLQDLQKARTARESLGAHDRVLLDALEPWSQTPPDLRESERRFEAAAKGDPASAELAYELGWVLHHTADGARALAEFMVATDKDPTNAMAWGMKAREQVAADDVQGALASYDQCLKVSPGGTSCLSDLATLQAEEGKCDAMAATVRHLIAVAPDVADSYDRLAQALFSLGEPLGAVRAALEQKWERLPAKRRARLQLRDEAALALLAGRFDENDRLNRQVEESDASAPGEKSHYFPAFERMLDYLETGRRREALDLANDYLGRRAAWQTHDLGIEPSLSVQWIRLAAGGIDQATFATLRDRWLQQERARSERGALASSGYEGMRWSAAYASVVATPTDAASALLARPDIHPLIDALGSTPHYTEPIGRTYALAGKLDEAIAILTKVSQSCGVTDTFAPIYSTWAAFDLGQAQETRGDATGACASYRRVLQRWGAAKPPSQTAARARARVRALRCATE
jgi:serine/threonine-protein kinase